MRNRMPYFFFFISLVLFYGIMKGEEADESKTEKVGNFSLAASQQPYPLSFFGGNIIDKGLIQFFILGDAITGSQFYKSDIVPGFLYGITNSFSIFFNVPIAPRNKDHKHRSSGLEDIFIQLEYAFYAKANKKSSTQATVVGNIAFPTGSFTKNPITGFGSISFLTGLTLTHTRLYWIYAADLALILPTKHKNFKAGNQFLYQAAIGRNIYTTHGWIFALFAEFSGLNTCKNIVNNRKDPNSGGNIISVIPSFWISSETLILEFGIGFPITQHLFGKQSKQRISYNFRFGWTLK